MAKAGGLCIELRNHDMTMKTLVNSELLKVLPGGCKSLSVICSAGARAKARGAAALSPALGRTPFGCGEVMASGASRMQPHPKGVARLKNWSRAGQIGFLLGCRQTHPSCKINRP